MSFRIPLRISSCPQQLFFSFQNYPIFCIGMARLQYWRFMANDKGSWLPLSLLHFSSILFYFFGPDIPSSHAGLCPVYVQERLFGRASS
jgi:hypothetical protein